MKRVFPGLFTLAKMGVVAWAGLCRPEVHRASRGADETTTAPAEARVRSLLKSAREGDVTAYLEAFDGPIRQRIERAIEELGRETFAAEPDGDAAASVAVETVYSDRIERQTFRLERSPGGWLVTDLNTVRAHEPAARFGTTASFQEPEGVPVQSIGTALPPEIP